MKAMKLEDMKKSIIVLNAGWIPLSILNANREADWQKAATYLLVDGFNTHGETIKIVNGPSYSLEIKNFIVQTTDHYRMPKEYTTDTKIGNKGNKIILTRDNYTCAYCLGHGNTVDHIIPESRGGQNTLGNLVTACFNCNQKKGNRTPLEANMDMLYVPSTIPHPLSLAREYIETYQFDTL